ncbi:MAG: polysulfide reductase NrfD, partial [bacterium]|nr:polysulfide reductase NrfD [bacterium]
MLVTGGSRLDVPLFEGFTRLVSHFSKHLLSIHYFSELRVRYRLRRGVKIISKPPPRFSPFLLRILAPSLLWGLLIVVYLYVGGLSAGLFLLSSVLTFVRNERLRPLARTAALIAPWPVILGATLLIFDLGQPLRFWRLFSTIEWASPMSIGS